MSNARTTAWVSSRRSQRHPARQVAKERLDDVSMASVADDPQRRVGDPRRGEPPGIGDRVDVLVPLQHTDEQRDRVVGQRNEWGLGERAQLGVGRERGRGLDARILNDARREGRQRPYGVGAADRDERRPIREGRDHGAGGRAVEPRPRAPVAVDLDDDGGVTAGERPTRERRERLVGALREDRIRRMPPELARDPHRQRSVEHGPVERRDRRPALERERAVAGRAVSRRGREHPEVEPLLERVELARERCAERQAVPRPPDHQHPGLHRPASSMIRTIRSSTRASAEVGHRVGGLGGERRAKSLVAGEPADRRRDRLDVAGRDEQAVLLVVDDLRDAADRGRDDGRSHRERLDDAVREVLPGRGGERGVRRAVQREDLVAGERPGEADAVGDAERAGPTLERLPLGPVARHDQRDVADAGDRLERVAERLLAREAARGREREAVQAERRARVVASRERGQRWRRVRHDHQPLGGDTPAQREVAQVRARDDHPRRAAQRGVPRCAQEADLRVAALRLELLERPAEPTRARRRARTPRPRRASRRAAAARGSRQAPRAGPSTSHRPGRTAAPHARRHARRRGAGAAAGRAREIQRTG